MDIDQRPVMEFPCRFPIKAMGRTDSSLTQQVETLVRRHAPDLKPEDVSTRPSARGNYVSITVTVTATSREQLDAIYLDLNAHDSILMTL
jgi:putative lipoic acid-binding regulatory protein